MWTKITVKIELRCQDEIAFDNPKDLISVI